MERIKGERQDKNEPVLKVGLNRVRGVLYSVLPNGYLYQRFGITHSKAICPVCQRRRPLPSIWELVDVSKYNLRGQTYPIDVQPGWKYYVNKDGDVRRYLWHYKESPEKIEYFKALKNAPPKSVLSLSWLGRVEMLKWQRERLKELGFNDETIKSIYGIFLKNWRGVKFNPGKFEDLSTYDM